jgi:two-component system chemotaxis response regulator CheY
MHHVLIVDDEEDIRKVIRLQLGGTRYEILEAEGAEQAIERLKENALTVDVIICDVRMPKISGVEAVDYFLSNFPSTPVLVLTGFPDLNLAVEFMKKGVLDYLVKPVEKEKLIKAVDNAAKQRKIF